MQYNKRISKVSFVFLLPALFTDFCFVRLALTGKLIRMCSPIYANFCLFSNMYIQGFLITQLQYLNTILINYLFDYLFLKNEQLYQNIRRGIKKTQFHLDSAWFFYFLCEYMKSHLFFMVMLSCYYHYILSIIVTPFISWDYKSKIIQFYLFFDIVIIVILLVKLIVGVKYMFS